MKRKFLTLGLAGIILASSLLTGCAGKDQNTAETEETEMTENAGQSAEDQKQTGIAGESASDSQIAPVYTFKVIMHLTHDCL